MLILKNPYLLTLNATDDFGRYSLCVHNGLIHDIIKYEDEQTASEKYKMWSHELGAEPEIIDCSQKIIMPALFNSCLKSESALMKYLLRKRGYDESKRDLCTDFIFNYIYQELPSSEIINDLDILYKFSFVKNLKFGVSHINEITPRKDNNHLQAIYKAAEAASQNVNVCFPFKQKSEHLNGNNYSYYLTDENQLTIYELSVLGELKNEHPVHLFLEVAVNNEATEKFKQTYNKPIILLLDEYGLIDDKTSLINPLRLTYDEIKILSDKRSNIIVCPSDLMHFTNRYFPLDDFLNHEIKFSIGSGWLGEDLFSEIRIFRDKYKELNISNVDFLKSITHTPRSIYGEEGVLVPNKSADMIFIDISDVRFQLMPENTSASKVCDFLTDNLTPFIISDVMIKGKFSVRNHEPVNINEDEIIKEAAKTRDRLYIAGKYDELLKRSEERKGVEELDLRSRDDEEIKLFSDAGAAIQLPREEEETEFRIKGKMPVFKYKTLHFQKNLFEEKETKQQSVEYFGEEYQESPKLNLLYSELDDSIANSREEEEILQTRLAEKRILKTRVPEETHGKIELPKGVKLKFGD